MEYHAKMRLFDFKNRAYTLISYGLNERGSVDSPWSDEPMLRPAATPPHPAKVAATSGRRDSGRYNLITDAQNTGQISHALGADPVIQTWYMAWHFESA